MSANPTPPILSLVQKGSDQFPRYIIVKGDAIRNPLYWNAESEDWHSDESRATVFADVNQVLWEHHGLMMQSHWRSALPQVHVSDDGRTLRREA